MKTKPSTFTALALLLIITAAFFCGCKKDDSLPWPLSELPPATQSGENTFGCLINGEPFVPGIYVWDPISQALNVSYDEPNYGWEDDNRLIVHSHCKRYNDNDSVSIILNFALFPLFSTGKYTISNTNYFNSNSYFTKNGPLKIYEIDESALNQVTITRLDTAVNIASGTFEMNLREIDDSTDILQIRHGRFDVRYFPE